MVKIKYIIILVMFVLVGILYLSRNIDTGIADSPTPPEDQSVAVGTISGSGYICNAFLEAHRVDKNLQHLDLVVCQKK